MTPDLAAEVAVLREAVVALTARVEELEEDGVPLLRATERRKYNLTRSCSNDRA